MRKLLLNVAGFFFALLFALPAQPQTPTTAFPTNRADAKAAIKTSLQSVGSFPVDALENRASLKRLMADLDKRYNPAPPIEEVKQLLMWSEPSLAAQLRLIDPDGAQLLNTAFARQNLRAPNPDLQRVREETWPPDLTNGEKVALQEYSGSGAGPMNQDLRTKGNVPPSYAIIHERMQSAFKKARPFSPPVPLARGANVQKPFLDTLLAELSAAHKNKTTYVMHGYVSTTYGANVLPGFMGNVHMHIKATHGLDLYPISLFPEEKEVLLNHNSTYRVTSMKVVANRNIIELEQIPPEK